MFRFDITVGNCTPCGAIFVNPLGGTTKHNKVSEVKMGHKLEQNKVVNSRTDFFYYMFRNILLFGIPLLIISGLVLSHLSFYSSATSPDTDSLAITISSSCTLNSTVNIPHSAEVFNGNYETNIGKTTVKTLCNDGNGYSVYAIGYSNNEEGNNKLINSQYPEYSIDTGLATSGLTSAWAMKLNNIENDPSPTPPVIEEGYDNTYGIIPNHWTKVASRPSGTTDMSQGSSFTTTYSVYASSSQYAGTYVGQVKYLLTHPSTMPVYPIMQDIANWKNIRLPNVGDSVQAIDKRDGKKYWVARLTDGHIWMTQNLDFDIVADEQDPTKMKTLTSEDTDLTDHSLTGAYSGANGYSYDESTGITSWTPANSAKTINFTGSTVTGWQNSNTIPYSASKTNDTNTGHASLGNYYNWTLAIASNDSNTLTNSTVNNINNNPQNSICPKGWRLPTISNESGTLIDSTNEFARLNYLYNNGATSSDADLILSPIYLIKAGYIGGVLDWVTEGFYTSSTLSDARNNYVFNFKSTKVELNRALYKSYGYSIRCVVR